VILSDRCRVFTERTAAESDCRSDDRSVGNISGAELQHVVVNRGYYGRIRKYVAVAALLL